MIEEEKQPFTAHLDELRKRLIVCFAAVGVGFVACYFFKVELFYILVAPLQKVMKSGETLIYTHLPEAFFTFLKTAFIGGALFGYFIVFPFGFQFFLSFATDTIRPMPSMKEYLGFASKLLLAFGLVFELPLVITFLARLGIVTVDFLKKNRKYAILLFFVMAAILTPPDVVTQFMMAMPMIALYEVSIIGARIFGKKRDASEETEDGGMDEAAE